MFNPSPSTSMAGSRLTAFVLAAFVLAAFPLGAFVLAPFVLATFVGRNIPSHQSGMPSRSESKISSRSAYSLVVMVTPDNA